MRELVAPPQLAAQRGAHDHRRLISRDLARSDPAGKEVLWGSSGKCWNKVVAGEAAWGSGSQDPLTTRDPAYRPAPHAWKMDEYGAGHDDGIARGLVVGYLPSRPLRPQRARTIFLFVREI